MGKVNFQSQLCKLSAKLLYMSDFLSTDSYKGVRDFYPNDWARLQAAFSRVREVLTAYGYEEYNASPMELAELYEKKTSEEIVSEQTYTFEDRGGRRVTLRPEMTPTLARMVAGKRRELSFPLRWFSIGNRFRYERPQRGRLREFYQVDVDMIGLPMGEADVEIIMIADEVLKSFGATGTEYIVRVNSRTLLTKACEAAGLTPESTKTYMRVLDKKDKMEADAFSAAVKEITETDPLSLIESNDERIAAEKSEVLALVETLKSRGVNAVFDPTLTRGFDYYTGTTFEIFDTDPANPRALLGGGRYDRLLTLFGGDPIPAIGFAMGDVTLLDFLETHNLLPETHTAPQVYLGTPTPEDRERAAMYAKTLREEGLRVFVNLTEKSLGDQVRDAVKRGIPFFLPFGATEEETGKVKLKALETGAENEIPSTDVAEYVAAL